MYLVYYLPIRNNYRTYDLYIITHAYKTGTLIVNNYYKKKGEGRLLVMGRIGNTPGVPADQYGPEYE